MKSSRDQDLALGVPSGVLSAKFSAAPALSPFTSGLRHCFLATDNLLRAQSCPVYIWAATPWL